jgi:hypothetical protein
MIYALDEACKRHAIDLIPSVILTSTLVDHVAVDLVKNFSYPMIFVSIVFNPYDIEKELHLDDVDATEHGAGVAANRQQTVEQCCKNACERFFASIQQSRYCSVSVSCNSWTNRIVEPLVRRIISFCTALLCVEVTYVHSAAENCFKARSQCG